MSAPRRFIVDTDTGSDDVWAIVEALRATDRVHVEAITVVCGNLPLELCVKNAMLAEDAAGTYAPPVYRGMERPLLRRRAFYAPEVHGDDGLSGMHLPAPARAPEKEHAVDAIIRRVMAAPGELEIATCGPLTNLAMALLKEPRLAENIKKVWVLGGAAGGCGNMTPAAEYNVYVDPEAAAIVLDAGLNAVWVTWDAGRGEAEITDAEAERLLRCDSEAGRFCARCTRRLREYYRERYGKNTCSVVDSLLMTAALYPEIMRGSFRAHCTVELAGTATRGYFCMDRHAGRSETPTVCVCPAVDAALYKEHLFRLLGAG